jgi:2-succinyl-5-enolpyruvyl-6-hydroxy-3-cyclohexene-1-carboxylate synthase
VQLPDDPWRDRLGSAWGQFPASEPGLLAALDRAMGDGAVVFVGNSLPIREWNLVAGGAGRGRSCHAARGANGIDGQLSQGLGVGAWASESWVVVGDLTALYDLSAPFWLEQLRHPGHERRCRLVVVNNGGGRIFSRLPAFAGLGEAQRRVTENRHSARFADWAAMWGLAHVRVSDQAGLAPDRVRAWPDEVVVELVPDEDQTRAFWDWWQAEAGAAR